MRRRRAASFGVKRQFSVVSFCCFLLLSLVSTPIYADNESVLLRYDPPVGKVLEYRSSSSVQLTVYGMETFINQSMEFEMSFPDTTSDEGRIVDITINKVSGSVMRGERTMDYEPPLKLEGKKVTVLVSPRGEVLKVTPQGYIAGMKSLDQLKTVFEDLFPALPDSTLQVGSKWNDRREEKSESETSTMDMEYKLKKIEDYKGIKVAVVEGKIKMTGMQQSPKGTIEGSGKGKLKAKLAVDGGYMTECKYHLDIKGTLVGGAGGDEKSKEMLMSIYFRCKLKKK